jgi:hypothetical protein
VPAAAAAEADLILTRTRAKINEPGFLRKKLIRGDKLSRADKACQLQKVVPTN